MNQWVLLFVAPLLAYSSPSIGGYSFSAHYLLVPLAALLGGRFGVTGVICVALGGLAFVINVGGPWGSIGGNPALYLAALAAAAVAAMPRPAVEWPHWPGEDRAAAWLAFAAPFLLALVAGTGDMRLPETGLWFAFRFWLAPLGLFLLFALGARGVRAWPLLLGLAAAAALTWWLEKNGLLARSPVAFFVTVSPLHPVTALAALAAFSAGAAMRALLRGSPLPAFWRRPRVAIAALVALWFASAVLASVPGRLAGASAILVIQSAAMLPIAAFMAGLLRGARGVVSVSILVPALMILWVIAAWLVSEWFDRDFRAGRLPLEAPFVTAAFAVLGAMIAQRRAGAGRFHLPRYPAYVVLLAAAALAIFGAGSPARLAAVGLFVAGGLAVFFAGARLGRAMAGAGVAITAERWVSFTALVLLAAASAVNFNAVVDFLRQTYYGFPLLHAIHDPVDAATVRRALGASINPELAALFAALAAIYLLALASVLGGLLSSVPKIWRDARRIAAFARRPR